MPSLVLFLFFCSGATALVYEVIWSKYLGLMFGSTVQAQTVVLAVFMGGLALGNKLFGRRSDLLAQPLITYGILEIIIGLYAFFFSSLHGAADRVFIAVGASIIDKSYLLLALKGLLSILLLLLPTVLMGGTLPLLASWLQRVMKGDAGKVSARFYAINSIGAVCGSALAGFFIVRQLGLVAGLQLTAFFNVVIGLAAFVLGRRQAFVRTPEEEKRTAADARQPLPGKVILGCTLVAITGAVSMGLEVVAARFLSLIFGASLQAFAIVLMAFILGIGLGSAVIASLPAARLSRPGFTIGLLIGAAMLISIYVTQIENITIAYSALRYGLAPNSTGFIYHQVIAGLISLVLLGLPAALLGGVVPVWIRILSDLSGGLGNQVGRLLTCNTLGAVTGVLVTGFVLMPTLGLRGSFTALALTLGLIATALALWLQLKKLTVVAATATVWIVIAVTAFGENWRDVLATGVFRTRRILTRQSFQERRNQMVTLFYEDAPDATVLVEAIKGKETTHRTLRINGKPDASTTADLPTQYLLAHLPMMTRPEATDVFVLGFGSGITAGALLGHPVKQVVVAENCNPVLKAAHFFEPWNRGVLKDPRTRIWNEDARTVLKLSPQKYDVIISEPSNPWVAGVGNVFSSEFYRIAAARLKPGGVMAQWFHFYEMSNEVVMTVLRTYCSVFPHVEVWEPAAGDLILIGSMQPRSTTSKNFNVLFERVEPRKDLERIGIVTPDLLFLRELASVRLAWAIAGEGLTQSDIFPFLEHAAPEAFFIGQTAERLFFFDERTLQLELAAPEKRAACQRIDTPMLRRAYETTKTGNAGLQQYFQWRMNTYPETTAVTPYPLNAEFPIIARASASFPPEANLSPGTPSSTERLIRAQVLARAHPARWKEAADEIAAVLNTNEKNRQWPAGPYAAFAAKLYLANGERALSRAILDRGLELDPNDIQLHFIARLAIGRPVTAPSKDRQTGSN